MAHAQKSTHSILGRNNPVTLGWANADQLRRTFRGRHGFALAGGVPRPREQRRVAHRRHHYRGAGPPLRQLYAKLSKSHSAWTPGNTPHRRENRTILVRRNLWRLVAGERLVRRQSRRGTLGRTVPARDSLVATSLLASPYSPRPSKARAKSYIRNLRTASLKKTL